MNIYKVYVDDETRINWKGNWYDEYFGHVVVAKNEEEAIDIACAKGMLVPRELVTIKAVDLKEKGIVLSDFNAG